MKRQLQQMAAAGPVTGSQGSQAAGVSKPGSSGVRSQAGESEGGRSGISSAMTSNYGYGGGASAYSGRGWEERNRFGEPTASTESLSMGPAKVFYETQQISPAPGQTHFQLAIELPRSNPTAPRVVLRDWPRQRMSQRWTRGGSLNPGQTTMTMAEFLDGEMEEKLVWIFGKSEYDKAVREGMRCVEEQGKEAEAASREKSRGTVKGGSVISGSSRS
ncbi:hypothetical protein HK101_001685 [Irineochytrium annulatum]|nr:hypothetical protein HK101_001685 [Irineochytrium annulatum]